MKNDLFQKRLGLALGGGAALGAAHIGVLQALEDFNVKIRCIAGASVGAVVGTLYAFGVPLEEIKHFALHLGWSDILHFNVSKMGLLSNETLGRMVQSRLGDCCLEDAVLPVAIVATDIERAEEVFITKGDIKTAIMASTCLPGVFVPIECDGRLLVDGGLLENMPLSPLRDMGADFRVGVDLTAKRGNYPRPHNLIGVMINAIEMGIARTTRLKTQTADLLISPDLSDFTVIDASHTEHIIQRGYEAACQALKGE